MHASRIFDLVSSLGVPPPAPAPARADYTVVLVVSILGLIVVAVIVTTWVTRRRQGRMIEAARSEQIAHRSLAAERDEIMFQEHRELNALSKQKLQLELKLMETQLSLMMADLNKRSEASDYHSTMLEKAQLEIDSLRLHIREQRKRLDDYGQYGE